MLFLSVCSPCLCVGVLPLYQSIANLSNVPPSVFRARLFFYHFLPPLSWLALYAYLYISIHRSLDTFYPLSLAAPLHVLLGQGLASPRLQRPTRHSLLFVFIPPPTLPSFGTSCVPVSLNFLVFPLYPSRQCLCLCSYRLLTVCPYHMLGEKFLLFRITYRARRFFHDSSMQSPCSLFCSSLFLTSPLDACWQL